MLELCGGSVVRDGMCALPSVSILSEERERWNEAGTGVDGAEACDNRGEEGGQETSAGGTTETGRSETIRGAAEKVVGLLVREECALLVERCW